MYKMIPAMLAMALASQLFAFSDLAFTPDTINTNQSTTLTGSYAHPGDSLDVFFFFDFDGDGGYDPDVDVVQYDSRSEGEVIIDGDNEMDEVADGQLEIPFAAGDGPFNQPGSYVMIVDDGVADTARITVKRVPTNTYVRGTVTAPDGPLAGLYVVAEYTLDSTAHVVDMSQSDGSFLLYLPPQVRGKSIRLMTYDENNVLAGKALIAPRDSEIVITDSIVDFSFRLTAASRFLRGRVVDEAGASVPHAVLRLESRSVHTGREIECDGTGAFVVPVEADTFCLQLYTGETSGFMYPDTGFTVASGADTVSLVYRILTADNAISGTIIDQAGIDLERQMYIEAYVKDEASMRVYHGRGIIAADGTFMLPVRSQFQKYYINAGVDRLPDGFYVTPSSFEGVAPGTSGLTIAIRQAAQTAVITVRDQHDAAAPGVRLVISAENSNRQDTLVADQSGKLTVAVYPGVWSMELADGAFMATRDTFLVTGTAETLAVDYAVVKADAFISGRIVGDIGPILRQLQVEAKFWDDSTNTSYRSNVVPDSSGAFRLPVAGSFGLCQVTLNWWSLPRDRYVVSPSMDGPDYPYFSVTPGDTGLRFGIWLAEGVISGKFAMSFPTKIANVGIVAVDSVRGIVLTARAAEDSTFSLKVPNGVYTVMAGYWSPEDTVLQTVRGVAVENNTVVLAVSNQGIAAPVVALTTPPPAFEMKVFSTNGQTAISIVSPQSGLVQLNLFDLRGRLVAALLDKRLGAGRYTVRLHGATTVAPGSYIARLSIQGARPVHATRPLVIVR
jgi:hypothetical protein